MPRRKSDSSEKTYPLRTVTRLTGLSPELLRAWERRYAVVQPKRSPGGTRRYTAADVERLRLLKSAVDAGHRIGRVAKWDADEWKRLEAPAPASPTGCVDGILDAIENLDSAECRRLLALELSTLGPAVFARDVASPLVNEIGERWADGRIGIAHEHLATGVLRSLLGSALQPTAVSAVGPRVLFATPAGERHELGLLMAALYALGAGANPIYLASDLPVEEILDAAERSQAVAVALSIVTLPPAEAERALDEIRTGVGSERAVWIGGAGAQDLDLPNGVEYLESLEVLEQRVMLLGLGRTQRS